MVVSTNQGNRKQNRHDNYYKNSRVRNEIRSLVNLLRNRRSPKTTLPWHYGIETLLQQKINQMRSQNI